jgi:hypothetical protein
MEEGLHPRPSFIYRAALKLVVAPKKAFLIGIGTIINFARFLYSPWYILKHGYENEHAKNEMVPEPDVDCTFCRNVCRNESTAKQCIVSGFLQ